MALSYNTETFVNIQDDLKNQLGSGKLSMDNADSYLRQKYNVTGLEYNNAATQAIEAEKKYFEMKEEFEGSPTSFLGIASSYIPAHLREQEESTFQSILNLPAKAVQSGVRTVKGLADIGEMILPEAVTKPIAEVAGDVDDALSGIKPYEALKTTFDPATNKVEEVIGDLGAIFAGGSGVANLISKAAPALTARKIVTLGGSIPSIAGFTAAEVVVTDKNQNFANAIIDTWPGSKEYLENLAINPDDDDSIKLLKKGLEGLGFGVISELAIKGIGVGYKALKGKNKAIVEDDILTPPVDNTGKITDVKVEKLDDGSYQQRVRIREPIRILNRVKKDKDSKGVTGFLARWLTSRQGLGRQSYRASSDLESAVRSATKTAQLQGKEFIKVLEKEYGTSLDKIPVEDLELVNDALGRVPALGVDASDEVLKVLKKKPSERTKKLKPPKPLKEGAKPRKKSKKPPKISDEEILDDYTARIIAAARQRQGDALNKIPEGLKKEVERLRAIVDDNSEELIERGLSGSKTVAIDNKAGLYLTTDYEIFTNPQWLKRVKEVANATLKERKEMTDLEALDIIEGVTEFVKKEYTSLAGNPVQIKNEVNKIISKFEGGEEEFFKLLDEGVQTVNQPSLGKIITGRKYIPQEIRALLKEVDNPTSRVMSTLDKQGKLIAEHQFLQDIRDIAVRDVGSDLFRVGPKFKPSPREMKADVEGVTQTLDDTTTFAGDLESIANNYIRTLGPNANPLIGVFSTNSFKKKLSEGLEVASPNNSFLKAMHGLQALSSGAQTIASEATHLINLSGNVVFTFGNGNFMPWRAKNILEGLKKMSTYSPDLNNLINKSGTKLKINIDEYRDLQERGLVNSGVNQEYFFRSLDDALTKPDKFFNPTGKQGSKIKKAPGQIYSGLATVYRAEDDIFKVFNYYQELYKLRRAYPRDGKFGNYSDDMLKDMATDTVKDILPMYPKIPRALKGMRSFPVVGAFPSFLVESFRITKNTAKIGSREFLRGLITGNKQLMINGSERLAGFIGTSALGAGYLISGNKKNDISETDNKVVDYFSPMYDRNSTRSYQTPLRINPKNGQIETVFINVSRNNPNDAPAKFVKALYQYADSGRLTSISQINEVVKKLVQVFDPLITESLALEPILNIIRNNKQGRRIWKEGADPDEIMLAIGKELTDKNIPKTIIDIIRTQEASDSHDAQEKENKGYPNLTADERKNFSAANRKGFPNRLEDRIKRFYGITQQTFNFNKALQVNVSNKMRLINSLDAQLRGELSDYQSGIKADMSIPENVKELADKVDNYILKNYRAQKQLAESLHEAKKLEYFDRKKNKVKIDDQRLRSILSSEGSYNEPELIRSALVYRNGNRGEFRPSLFSSTTGKRAMKTLGIPKAVVQVIQNRLAQYARRATPLISREPKE